MAVTVLLCATLDEGKALAIPGMHVMSVGQYPRAFEGLRVLAVYATEAARSHPYYRRVWLTLQRSSLKTKLPTGVEKVV